jgi:4-amino-4-deoxy-L-arabinose transferase-like glycosyltransferase
MLKKKDVTELLFPGFLLVCVYLCIIALRPLLPIDETRYMSVAWEMHLRGDWLAPLTVNFQPYHHKPPLLFWLINLCWSIFGISRWAGTLPVLAASTACIFLTRKLSALLFEDNPEISRKTPFVMTGSLAFLVSGLLVMFDITLTVFVLLSLLALVSFAKSEKIKYIFWMALAMGFGVLTKGPVAWLYVLFPILTGPLWMPVRMKPSKWYGSCTLSFLLSILPVLLWLIPVLSQSSSEFAYWLVWEQTFGRVTGRFAGAHVRAFWFYLQFLPVVCLPWFFLPSFWKGFRQLKENYSNDWAIRFLALWIIPLFIAFNLIRGKQPQYLVPFLPAIAVAVAYMVKTPLKQIVKITLAMVILTMVLHVAASRTIFKKLDLNPMVEFLETHKNAELAFVGSYHGELNFLARLEKAVDENQTMDSIDEWFKTHKNGLAIIRYNNPVEVQKYKILFDMPFRGRRICIFSQPQQNI